MFKKYFTDGLIQVAIVISLLRSDVNNYINTLVDHNYPEMQEIILGTSLAYTQTNFHRSNQQPDLGGYTHLKSLDSYYSSSVFRDLFTPESYRNSFHVPTNIDAWLVSDLQPPMLHAANTSTNDSEQASTVNNAAQVDNLTQVENAVSQQVSGGTSGSDIREVEPVSPESTLSTSPGSELTKEDMDLIEVLWRQDIDLGVGRDVFDITLRKELEKERELKLQQQQQEEAKIAKLLREKLADESTQHSINNYVLDSETGEMVVAPPGVSGQNAPMTQSSLSDDEPPPLEAVEDFSIEDAMRVLEVQQTLVEPPHQNNYTSHSLDEMETLIQSVQPQLAMPMAAHPSVPIGAQPIMPMVTECNVPMTAQPNMPMDAQQDVVPRPQFETQTSFELRWQDVASILDLPAITNHTITSDLTMENVTTAATMPTSDALLQNVSLTNNINTNNLTQSFNMPVVSAGNFTPVNNTTETIPPALLAPVSTMAGPLPMTYFNMDTHDLVYTGANTPMAVDNDTFSNTTGTLFQNLLDDTVDDFTFPNVSFASGPVSATTNKPFDDAASDSAISSMEDSSHTQDCNDSNSDISPFDGLEGATGGCSNGAKQMANYNGYDAGYSDASGSSFSRQSADRSFNHSGSANSSRDVEAADFRQVLHNHTYPTQPGQQPRQVKKYATGQNGASTSNGGCGDLFKGGRRSMMKMAQKNLPFTISEITDCPVERFMEMLHKYMLTDTQLQMIKDIRRRGKNKVAAQNCRKRKLDVLSSLEEEVFNLEQQKEQLMEEGADLAKERADTNDKVQQLYTQLFHTLRDDNGQPYDPNEFSLQYTADGDVFIVPRNTSSSSHLCIDSHSEKCTKKRKPKKGD